VEAKAFYFSVKAEVTEIHLEERRKGFCGYIFLGLQGSEWLLATVEEALKEPVKKDFVKTFQEDVNVLKVGRGGNKASCYLEVASFVEGGRKGVVWLSEGHEGWGWSRIVGELRKMISFSAHRLGHWFLRCLDWRGLRRGVSHPVVWVGALLFAEVVRGEAGSLVKHPGLRALELERGDLDLFPEAWCRVVEDGRLAVNYYALEEQLLGSMEKKTNPICFLGDGEARKKKKVGHFRSWKKLLEWLGAALDWVSNSGFKWARLGLKSKRGNQAGSKALVFCKPWVGFSRF